MNLDFDPTDITLYIYNGQLGQVQNGTAWGLPVVTCYVLISIS